MATCKHCEVISSNTSLSTENSYSAFVSTHLLMSLLFSVLPTSAMPASSPVWYISVYIKNVPLGTLFLWERAGFVGTKMLLFTEITNS